MKNLLNPPTLVVEAHSDDAIGLLYHEVIGRVSTTHVLTATEGEVSSISLDPNLSVAAGGRVQESEAVLARHGVSQDRQHQLPLPDGMLASHILPLSRAIIAIVQKYGIKHIYSLADDDEHSDHASTYMAVRLSVNYLRHIDEQTDIVHIARTNASRADYSAVGDPAKKRSALLDYRSQFNEDRLALDTPEIIALREQFTTEYYRIVPALRNAADFMAYCRFVNKGALAYQAT